MKIILALLLLLVVVSPARGAHQFIEIPLPTVEQARDVVVTDLDDDGDMDIMGLSFNISTGPSVRHFLGDGAGGFAAQPAIALQPLLAGTPCAVSHFGDTGHVRVMKNNGVMSMVVTSDIYFGTVAPGWFRFVREEQGWRCVDFEKTDSLHLDLEIADMNNDNHVDVVVSTVNSQPTRTRKKDAVRVFLSGADEASMKQTVLPNRFSPCHQGPRNPAWTDVEIRPWKNAGKHNDAIPDIAAVSFNWRIAQVWQGRSQGGFHAPIPIQFQPCSVPPELFYRYYQGSPLALKILDFPNLETSLGPDGVEDFATILFNGGFVVRRYMRDDGSLPLIEYDPQPDPDADEYDSQINAGACLTGFDIADLDGNSFPDVVSTAGCGVNGQGTLSVKLQLSPYTAVQSSFQTDLPLRKPHAIDLNADGLIDVVAAGGSATAGVTVWIQE